MRDIRDYLEAKLEVGRLCSCLSLPSWGLSLQSVGPGASMGMTFIRTKLLTNLEWFTTL